MHPLLMLVAGLAVGVMGVRLAKSENARKALQTTATTTGQTVRTGLNQARSEVRDVAVSGLKTIETTSAVLRRKLDDTSPDKMPETPAGPGSARAADGGQEGS